MDQKLDLSLPWVPPPPEGERIEARARGLAGLIAAQESAVVYHRSERLTAMVIVLNGRVVDAVAESKSEVIKGVDVLDELGDVPVADLQVIGVSPRLARAMPVYWRAPGATREMVASLVQPGRRGAVLAASPLHGTGIVVFDERGIVASFVDGKMQEGAIDALLDDPGTIISPRVEARAGQKPLDLHAGEADEAPTTPEEQPAAASPTPAPASAAVRSQTPPQPEPVAAGPAPAPPSNDAPPAPASAYPGFPQPQPAGEPTADVRSSTPPPQSFGPPPSDPFGGWGGFNPAGAGPSAPPASPYGAPGGDAQLEPRRQAIIELLERDLGRHAESVSAPFRTAPTLEALQGAAQALANQTVRLVSSARMQNLSVQASAIARGEQPQS